MNINTKNSVLHKLKITPNWFAQVIGGIKKAELRVDDRGFDVGDRLLLRECGASGYTGKEVLVLVTHVVYLSDIKDQHGFPYELIMMSIALPVGGRLSSGKQLFEGGFSYVYK
jgi:hypothetical protein